MKTAAPIALFLALAAAQADARSEARYALTGFGGVLLDDVWEDVFLRPWTLDVQNSYLVGVAGAARIWRPTDWLDVEVEGQVVRHFGRQRHVEINAPIVTARWTAPPWSGWIDSTVAYGIGLSYAAEKPRLEQRFSGATEQVMVYWMIEVDAALPAEDWRLVGRLHHRSVAYGAFGETGGANALVLGLRRLF